MNYANITSLIKAKTKPIQTQTNPIASKGKIDAKYVFTKDYEEKCGYGPKKTNPIQTQFVERAKMNPFAWIRSLTTVVIMLLVDFTTLKGANFNGFRLA
jgi:hypothetical protein